MIRNKKRNSDLEILGLFLTLSLVGCGTFQVSVRAQDSTTPTPTSSDLSGPIFEDSIVLTGYALPNLEVSTNDLLPLQLYWRVITKPTRPYSLALALRGNDGRLMWQTSASSISWTPGRLTTEHLLRFPEYLAGADYGLEVWLYDPSDGKVASATGVNRNGIVRIASLQLTRSPSGSLIVPEATLVLTATVNPGIIR